VPFVTWLQAWQNALYGGSGFYRHAGPADHFATATHGQTGAVLAEALLTLARRHDIRRVVDVGAGRGELLAQMAALDPTMALTGVDVVERPEGLPERVEWLVSPGGANLPPELEGLVDTLVLAHEWLDVVPCPVAEVDDDGILRVVLVDPRSGEEKHGDPVTGADAEWAATHWPTDVPGERVEIGRARDEVWASLLTRLRSGVAVAVDYGHSAPDRPPYGTLTGFAHGGQVAPVPDGSCDITAHVAMDTLQHRTLVTQREALKDLGLSAARPALELARTDPRAYLAALARASHVATLLDPGGFGGFLWAVWPLPAPGEDAADSGA
jgi:SAM-dependent MidA family methyltransferase